MERLENLIAYEDTHVVVTVIGRHNSYRREVLIDLDDVPIIEKYGIHIQISTGYAILTCEGKHIRLHRFLLGVTDPKIIIDHFDRDPLNNRKSNLREATFSVNGHNKIKSKFNTSGRTGVRLKERKDRSNSWIGQYDVNGKRYEKGFSIEVYGNEQAYQMALTFRENGERENNILTDK